MAVKVAFVLGTILPKYNKHPDDPVYQIFQDPKVHLPIHIEDENGEYLSAGGKPRLFFSYEEVLQAKCSIDNIYRATLDDNGNISEVYERMT